MSDVGGQRCPDSVRIYCAVSVSQNIKFSVGRVFECPDFQFELDFDRQIPHSNSGQHCLPTSAENGHFDNCYFPGKSKNPI